MISPDENPFILIRGRKILTIFFLVPISVSIVVFVLWANGSHRALWPDIISQILAFCLVAYILNLVAKRAQLNIWLLIGRIPVKEEIVYYSLFAIPISFLSVGCIWMFYLPLSYLAPKFVNYLLIEDPIIIIWSKGPLFGAANLINFCLIVIIVPVFEEFVFRGLLLSRWSKKWGTRRAILFSSIIFGIGHVDIIGGVFFGYVMAVLYIKTRSLIIPILVHGTNNLIVWILTLVVTILYKPMSEYSLNDFQSEWWIGALCLIIGMPWGIRYLKSNWPELSWHAPYFA
jgi:membrane protease YdiL (CAAX protease family)